MTNTLRWTFLDYVDGNSVNRISEWLQSLPIEARAAFEAQLDILKVTKVLTRPQTGKRNEYDNLYEFVFKVRNVQCRPLFCYGPDTKAREITILAGAREKGDKLIPPNVCRTAANRASEISANRRQVVNHVRVR